MRIIEIEDDSVKLVCNAGNIILVESNKIENASDCKYKYYISIVVKDIEAPYVFFYKTIKMRNSRLTRIVTNMRRDADKL